MLPASDDADSAASVASAPPSMANTKAEIVQASVEAGYFETVEEAETWTKAELVDLWTVGE